MALPKLQHPTFNVVLPSNGKIFKFRPYTVKEQKILLTIKESTDEKEISELLTTLISACCESDGFAPKKLSSFDVEYIFLKLRSKSVGEVIDMNYKCNNIENDVPCGAVSGVKINLDDVKVDMEGTTPLEFEIGHGLTVKMSYPTLDDILKVEKYRQEKNLDYLIDAIAWTMDLVKDGEAVYDDFTAEEAKEFVTELDINSFDKFLDFFVNLPKLKYSTKFKCKKCGYEDNILLSGLTDFFA